MEFLGDKYPVSFEYFLSSLNWRCWKRISNTFCSDFIIENVYSGKNGNFSHKFNRFNLHFCWELPLDISECFIEYYYLEFWNCWQLESLFNFNYEIFLQLSLEREKSHYQQNDLILYKNNSIKRKVYQRFQLKCKWWSFLYFFLYFLKFK